MKPLRTGHDSAPRSGPNSGLADYLLISGIGVCLMRHFQCGGANGCTKVCAHSLLLSGLGDCFRAVQCAMCCTFGTNVLNFHSRAWHGLLSCLEWMVASCTFVERALPISYVLWTFYEMIRMNCDVQDHSWLSLCRWLACPNKCFPCLSEAEGCSTKWGLCGHASTSFLDQQPFCRWNACQWQWNAHPQGSSGRHPALHDCRVPEKSGVYGHPRP